MDKFLTKWYNIHAILDLKNDEELKQTGFNLNTTILELEEHFKTRAKLLASNRIRITLAPDKISCIRSMVKDLEEYYFREWEDPIQCPADYLAFHCITRGLNTTIEYFTNQITDFTGTKYVGTFLLESTLEEIAEGVSIAYILPELKEELNQLILEPNKDKDKDPDRLTTKQQVFLLQLLGVFDLPQIQRLTEQKRGILFGHLLNRNEKNTEDIIRNRYDSFSDKIQNPVLELLKKLGLDNL